MSSPASPCRVSLSEISKRVPGSAYPEAEPGVPRRSFGVGRTVSASEALAFGFVSRVVGDGALEDVGHETVRQMLVASDVGLRMTKETVNAAVSGATLEQIAEFEDRNRVLAMPLAE